LNFTAKCLYLTPKSTKCFRTIIPRISRLLEPQLLRSTCYVVRIKLRY